MRKYAFIVLLLSPVLVAAGGVDPGQKCQREKRCPRADASGLCQTGPRQKLNAEQKAELQGTWVASAAVGFGKDTPKDELRGLRLVFQGDRLTAHYGDRKAEATFQLDATHTPQWIDVTVKDGPEDVLGKTFRGIYLIEGNVLRVAFPDPGQARPKVFASAGQTQVHGILFKRQAKR